MRQGNYLKVMPGACDPEFSANHFLQFFAVDKLLNRQPADGNADELHVVTIETPDERLAVQHVIFQECPTRGDLTTNVARVDGAARGAHHYAMRYATERTAFGRPIAHHQALAFLIADLAIAVDAARLAVWRAAAALDRGETAEWEAATALAEAAEQALFVGPSAVQILGGHGFMKDHPVEKWMRDIRTLASLGGGREAAEVAAAGLAVEHEAGLR